MEGGDLELAIGAHYGPVVIGNIGTTQRLEFAVLGDTVNVASRLESATREIGCKGLASKSLVAAAEAEINGEEMGFVGRLSALDRISLRGRKEQIEVFAL